MKLSLVFEADGLAVALFERHALGWRKLQDTSVTWRENAENETLAERLQAALRPLLLAWAVPPQTSVLVVPASDVGGLVYTSLKDQDIVTTCEKALSSQLPYAVRELHYAWRLAPAESKRDKKQTTPAQALSIYWLPKSWLAEIRAAFTRLGLRIDEVYSRAFIYAASASSRAGDSLLLEHKQGSLTGYQFGANSLPLASFCLEGDDNNLTLQLGLALFAIAGQPTIYTSELSDALRNVCDRRWPGATLTPLHPGKDIAEQVFRRWHAGDSGIWFAPEPQRITSAITPWLIGAAVITLGLVVGFSWHERKLAKEVADLDTAAERLRPGFKVASSRQRELFGLQTTINQIDQFQKTPSPLPVLTAISEHLPEGSWLVHFHSNLTQVRLEGYGADVPAVSKAFADTPYRAVSDKQTGKPVHAVDETLKPFAVNIYDRPRLKPSASKQPVKPQPASQTSQPKT